MALGNELMAIPEVALPNMQDPNQALRTSRLAMPSMGAPAAGAAFDQAVGPEMDQLAEQLAAEQGEPPDLGMIASAIAGALPGPEQSQVRPPGSGGSFGMAPQMAVQVNPFQQPPATGTTNPGLGNLLKGITA